MPPPATSTSKSRGLIERASEVRPVKLSEKDSASIRKCNPSIRHSVIGVRFLKKPSLIPEAWRHRERTTSVSGREHTDEEIAAAHPYMNIVGNALPMLPSPCLSSLDLFADLNDDSPNQEVVAAPLVLSAEEARTFREHAKVAEKSKDSLEGLDEAIAYREYKIDQTFLWEMSS